MLSHLKTARRYFGYARALGVGKLAQQFVAQQLEAGYANASINRPLQMLKAAFRIAAEGRNGNPPKLPRAITIQLQDESDNVRKGKIGPGEAELQFNSPAHLADFARYEYAVASRPKENRQLRWSMVTDESIEVPASITKNGKSRTIALTPELQDILDRRRLARQPGCDLIFHDGAGQPVGDYRSPWYRAALVNGLGAWYCRDCRDEDGNLDSVLDDKLKCSRCARKYDWKRGKPKYRGKLLYDLKRSACHEMRKAGSSVEDCMQVSGHLTANMFKRYSDLFSDEEKRATQRQVQDRRRAWREAQARNVVTMPSRMARAN